MTRTSRARWLLLAASSIVVAGCSDVPQAPLTAPDLGEASLSAGQGVDRIEAAFRRASPEVMALSGTVFADNDERIARVVIGIEHMNAAGAVQAAMARLGVAEADYAIVLTPPIHFAVTLRDRFRPTQGGIQIHFTQFLCTMGFNVDHAGGRSFITNSHCTARQGGTEGTVYYQPTSTVDPTVIATEVDDPKYFRGGVCPKGKKCRHSDASRALYSSGVASNRGDIAQTTGFNNASITISSTNPTFTILTQDNLTKSFPIGLTVNKVGRTTGWTRGNVTRTCVNTSVSGSNIMQLCQTFVEDPGGAVVVGAGDSGSPVFAVTVGDNVQLVGILWGGSSDNKLYVFSPLASIQQELGSVVATK